MSDNLTCGTCANMDTNVDHKPICTLHDSFIATLKYKCDDYLTENEGKAKEFIEWCPYCEGETEYNFKDLDEEFEIRCKTVHCKEYLLACDFCKEYSDRFCESTKCHIHLTEAKQKYLERRKNAS